MDNMWIVHHVVTAHLPDLIEAKPQGMPWFPGYTLLRRAEDALVHGITMHLPLD